MDDTISVRDYRKKLTGGASCLRLNPFCMKPGYSPQCGLYAASQPGRHGTLLQALCAEAEKDLPGFWETRARTYHLACHSPGCRYEQSSFFRWFDDGELNVSFNCLDRHLTAQPDKIAIIFEADDGTTELHMLATFITAYASWPTALNRGALAGVIGLLFTCR